MTRCEHPGCEAAYQTVDGAFRKVCGLHREHRVTLMDTGRNLRDVPVQEMTDGELDASLGDLLTAVAAKQDDAWKAQRDAAAWKNLAEHLAHDHLGMTDDQFRAMRKQRGLA